MPGLIAEFEFSTDRLEISPASARVAPELDEVLSEEVTKFLPPNLRFSEGQTDPSAWLATLRADGPVFAIRDGQGLVGLLILHEPASDQIMLGYLFAQQAWGKGYATELLRGFTAALGAAGWTGTLSGGVDPGNRASAAVLLKAGFEASRDTGPGGSDFYTRMVGPP